MPTDPARAGTGAPVASAPSDDGTGLGALLLLAALLLAGILAGAMLHGDAASAPVEPHPEHASMLRTAGPPAPANVAWGYLAGVAMILLMGLVILLGVRKAGRLGRLGLGLAAGSAGLALVFTGLVAAYVGRDPGLAAEEAVFFGGFPAATAWMLYGMWWMPAAMTFALAYVFDRYWLTPADLERVRHLVRERQSRQGGEPT